MYARILVPLDGSERSERAIPVAIEMATKFSSHLYLLVAFDLTSALFVDKKESLPTDYRKLKEHQREKIGIYLQARKAELPGLAVTCLTMEEDPADAICSAAEKEAVDLILMTSHGTRGWTRWISGSVAESVLRRAPCPVLILRKRKRPAVSETPSPS